MLTANRSNVGCVRQINEDECWVGSINDYVYGAIVADGMGGHQAGDVASKMAVAAFCEAAKSGIPGQTCSRAESKMVMRQSIAEANSSVFARAAQEERFHHMGTTIVAAFVHDAIITIGHVGDSRAYKIANGKMEQLTPDHTLVNELVKSGQLTEQEAAEHPRRNVLTRAVGTDERVDIDVQSIDIAAGDIYLLCSDGLTNMVSDQQILNAIMNEELDLDGKADKLIQLALNGGGDDNVTVVLLQPSSDGMRKERLQ